MVYPDPRTAVVLATLIVSVSGAGCLASEEWSHLGTASNSLPDDLVERLDAAGCSEDRLVMRAKVWNAEPSPGNPDGWSHETRRYGGGVLGPSARNCWVVGDDAGWRYELDMRPDNVFKVGAVLPAEGLLTFDEAVAIASSRWGADALGDQRQGRIQLHQPWHLDVPVFEFYDTINRIPDGLRLVLDARDGSELEPSILDLPPERGFHLTVQPGVALEQRYSFELPEDHERLVLRIHRESVSGVYSGLRYALVGPGDQVLLQGNGDGWPSFEKVGRGTYTLVVAPGVIPDATVWMDACFLGGAREFPVWENRGVKPEPTRDWCGELATSAWLEA